jgi:hypothetical protein
MLLALLLKVDHDRVPDLVVLLTEFPQLVEHGSVQVFEEFGGLR